MMSNAVLEKYRNERRQCVEFVDRTLAQVEQRENGDMSDTEQESLRSQRERIEQLDKMIKPLAEFEQLATASNDTVRSYSTGAGRDDDRRGGGSQGGGQLGHIHTNPREHKYKTRGQVMVDLIRQEVGQFKSPGHTISISESERRAAADRLMGAGVVWPGADEEYVQRIAHETTAQVPGLMPEPIVGLVDNDLDAARPFISSIGAKDLSGIPGESFSRPVVTQHTRSGRQNGQKTELPSRQFTVGKVPFTKDTRGGSLNVARQTIDWTSPAAWDALLGDLQDEYAIDTEETAAAAFVAAVTTSVGSPDASDLRGWARAIYKAAASAYRGVRRMPDHMWVSLDMWADMGSIVDVARMALRRNGSDNSSLGSSSPTNFEGSVLDLPRTVVPSFPDGTIIVGVKSKTEFYEEKIGLLSAVEPKVLGVEIAYGGYIAHGTLRPAAFSKVAPPVAVVPEEDGGGA